MKNSFIRNSFTITMAKKQNSVKCFVSYFDTGVIKNQKVYDRWKALEIIFHWGQSKTF